MSDRTRDGASRPVGAAPPLVVALDLPAAGPAVELARGLRGRVAYVKVGLELFVAEGPDLVGELVRLGHRVLLDLKLHDIPTTVARAVRAARRSGASLLTVHAGGGRAMLRAAVEAAREPGLGPVIGLLGVTVLTSLDQEDLAEAGVVGTLEDHVLRLAGLAASEGLDGVVASPAEAGAVRAAHGPGLLIVTPGVRPAWAREAGDQARVATPREAVLAGADLVVVGRPVTGAADPVVAAEQLGEELADALSLRERRLAEERP